MGLRNGSPVEFVAQGLTDSIDSLFDGSCSTLSNLVFDRKNRGAVVPRPGVASVTSFAGFTTPGVVSAMISVGSKIYGLIATGRTANFDEPFCYDTAAGAFITVTGVTSLNVPATPLTTGTWSPPTMDVVGTKIVVTHPGFSGANFFGNFDISNPAAPAWNAGNTTTNALPSVPIWVVQFGGRAYFGCKNNVYFSDVLSALTISAANFAGALTLGDTTPTIGASGLAFSTSSAGILQSLVVFKANTIYQVSGDITGSGNGLLALNLMSANVGCTSPRTAQSTPYGVLFIATDGPRLVDLRGQIQYLVRDGETTPNLVDPFSSATTPSRACSGYNNSIYRVALDTLARDNGSVGSQVFAADYWYDFLFGRWTGRHSFQYHACVAIGPTFYLASNTTAGMLFQSDVIPTAATVFTDNAAAFTCSFISSALPMQDPMSEKCVIESTVELSSGSNPNAYTITAYDDQFNILGAAVPNLTLAGGRVAWGAGNWGTFKWSSLALSNHVYTIAWSTPIIFKKMLYGVSTIAAPSVAIRLSTFRYQKLGYVNV